jgi:hypothetical protein
VAGHPPAHRLFSGFQEVVFRSHLFGQFHGVAVLLELRDDMIGYDVALSRLLSPGYERSKVGWGKQ